MATPVVAGVAALIIGQGLPRVLSPHQVTRILQRTADPLVCPAREPYQPEVRAEHPLPEALLRTYAPTCDVVWSPRRYD